MKPEALPMIVLDEDNSSPSVPVGTGGPKSKSKAWFYVKIKLF